MKIGIQTFFSGNEQEPLAKYISGVGKILEERDFASVWMSEHAVTFPQYDPQYAYPYSDDGIPPPFLSQMGMLDPVSALTALAMATSRLRLGTSVALVPQRNPVYFAKMGAALDIISNGRFLAGVGLGWSGQEFAALQTPWAERGRRMDEYLQVIQSLWVDEPASFQGEFYELPECMQLPRPVQRPHPPFFCGGESKPALKRVARHCQGWLGFQLQPEQVAARLPYLEEELQKVGRSMDDIELVVSPGSQTCSAQMLSQYAELGISEVVVVCMANTLPEFERQADTYANSLVATAKHV